MVTPNPSFLTFLVAGRRIYCFHGGGRSIYCFHQAPHPVGRAWKGLEIGLQVPSLSGEGFMRCLFQSRGTTWVYPGGHVTAPGMPWMVCGLHSGLYLLVSMALVGTGDCEFLPVCWSAARIL